jgi:uncharacterized protein (TIGR02145 family)
MKIFCFLSIFFLIGLSFSQSKKEQIEQLTNRVDSLNQVLSSERSTSSQKVSEFNATISNLESKISSLNTTISNLTEISSTLQSKIVGLESDISTLNKKISSLEADKKELNTKVNGLTNELSTNKTNLAAKDQELNNLQSELNIKIDSLNLLRTESTNLKPAPKPVVTNNTNANNSNQSAQTSQTGGYKSVKIGTQTWMAENLNVERFRNGDLIPQAKTNEEWEKAGKEGKPAWCYYDNDPKNGAKYGKLYNWYAVNDPRGLAPAGWHIPTDTEWITLGDQLGNDAGKKMKSTSGWNGYGCKRCSGGSSQFKANCTSCKGTQNNSTEPFSGNGTNTSGFSGLPGGVRNGYGDFSSIGNYGYWWSSTEGSTGNAYSRNLYPGLGLLGRSSLSKGEGLSVRCLRD